MEHLTNKVAVITGAANGIGRALAIKCIESSMSVVIADNDVEKLNELESKLNNIKGSNNKVISVICDVSKITQIKSLAEETNVMFDAIDFIFNNAGILGPLGPIWDISSSEIRNLININIMGIYNSLMIFTPMMLKQKSKSHIINTASGQGLYTAPNLMGYDSTKHAVVALSEVLLHDLRQRKSNIDVHVICPGPVKSKLLLNVKNTYKDKCTQKTAEQLKDRIKSGLLPSEVADAVFEAIQKKYFYIFTHNTHKLRIKKRMEDILENKLTNHYMGHG